MNYLNVIPFEIHEGLSGHNSCALLLLHPDTQKVVPIVLSHPDAQTLVDALNSNNDNINSPLSLTLRIAKQFMLQIKECRIDSLLEGLFKASVIIDDGFNQHTIPCRIADCITLSILTLCPLLLNPQILQDAGCPANALIDNLPQPQPLNNQQPTLDQLLDEQRLCEEHEDYERAAELQRQIEKLLNKKQ